MNEDIEDIEGFELLAKLKNSAKIEQDGTGVNLVFEKEIKVSDSETTKVFSFTVPTLDNIEKALDSTAKIKDEQMSNLKQSYFLISSQFEPQFHPNDIAERLSIDELTMFNKVLDPFLS